MGARSHIVLAAACALVNAGAAHAQAVDPEMLEQRGRYGEAIQAYLAAIRDHPVLAEGWRGLERVFTTLGRLDSLIILTDSALAADSQNVLAWEVQLRVWSALEQPDSVAAAARRWIEAAPDSPIPYREWSFTLAREGDVEAAIALLREGRSRLGKAALAAELGYLYRTAGDWFAAAREWAGAVLESELGVGAAVAGLRQAPESQRETVLRVLIGHEAEPPVRRLGAELLVVWDRPEEGWTLLDSSLPPDRARAAPILQRFAERVRHVKTKEAQRARGYALERLAELTEGAQAERARLEAAQAFADAGNLGAARRMLEQLAVTGEGGLGDAASAMAVLIRVSVESGQIEEAETRLRLWETRLRGDDAALLRERIAWAWVLGGNLDRAEAILKEGGGLAGEGEASVSTEALLGWVALYRGDLKGAVEHFQAAGPYAQSREQATRRTSLLAVLQAIWADSVPELGEALLWLARGDTTRSIGALRAAALDMPAAGGRGALLAYAGDLAVAAGDIETAEPLLREALAADSLGSFAAAAEYALAVVLVRSGRNEEGESQLEHLILSHSESALLPEARRLLDRVRGVVPRT